MPFLIPRLVWHGDGGLKMFLVCVCHMQRLRPSLFPFSPIQVHDRKINNYTVCLVLVNKLIMSFQVPVSQDANSKYKRTFHCNM